MGIRRMIQTYLHTSHALRVLPWTKFDLFSHILLNHKWWLLVAWAITPNLTNMATGLNILHFVQQPIIIFHIVGYLSIYLFLSIFLFSYPFPALDSYVVSSFSLRYKRKITREREREKETEQKILFCGLPKIDDVFVYPNESTIISYARCVPIISS